MKVHSGVHAVQTAQLIRAINAVADSVKLVLVRK